MTDIKPGQGGKPNKFNQQNQHADERKAGENPRQGEPTKEPRTETDTETNTDTSESDTTTPKL